MNDSDDKLESSATNFLRFGTQGRASVHEKTQKKKRKKKQKSYILTKENWQSKSEFRVQNLEII